MTVIQIKKERTCSLKLSTQNDIMRGCLIKEYHFDCSALTFLKEIHFTNFYTKSASAQLCYQDTDSKEPIWVNVFKLQMMKDIHTPSGACTQVRISLPPTFETVKSRKRLFKLCILLQQPSPIWKEFTITNVQFFDEYPDNLNQEIAELSEVSHTYQMDDIQNALGTLCTLMEFKQATQNPDINETDISYLADARFETT